MKKRILAIFAPPVAVYHYGCAGYCAAPISVFWITGLFSLGYAFFGGPTGMEEFSKGTFFLGIILWFIATAWTELTIRGIESDKNEAHCNEKSSATSHTIKPKLDNSDPMDEVRKFQ